MLSYDKPCPGTILLPVSLTDSNEKLPSSLMLPDGLELGLLEEIGGLEAINDQHRQELAVLAADFRSSIVKPGPLSAGTSGSSSNAVSPSVIAA